MRANIMGVKLYMCYHQCTGTTLLVTVCCISALTASCKQTNNLHSTDEKTCNGTDRRLTVMHADTQHYSLATAHKHRCSLLLTHFKVQMKPLICAVPKWRVANQHPDDLHVPRFAERQEGETVSSFV